VDVRVGSKDLYFDPATLHCPFGLVPWQETGVSGYRIEDEGGVAVTTPVPAAAETLIQRKATLELDDERTLKGKLQVSFTGQEALERRLDAREMDDAGRRKELEDEVKTWLPAGATVKLADASGWENSGQSLEANFTVEVPSFGVPTGRRLLLPMAVFESGEAHRFQNTRRIHPVYFHYPYEEIDDVALELPKGYHLESLPKPHSIPSSAFGKYDLSAEDRSGVLHLNRQLVIQTLLIPVAYYPSLREFFNAVRSGDENQLVIQSAEVSQH
jgi:hypothetical protein